MGGATGSNQTVVTGRVNYSDGATIFWAKVPPEQSNFNGAAVLVVEEAKNMNRHPDKNSYKDGDTFKPSNQFDGIFARGASADSISRSMPGGTGVVGRGGRVQGTGVLGVGGGVPEENSNGGGGIGVHGVGGAVSVYFPNYTEPPGAGLVGQGGRQSETDNRLRLPHAPGVIGIGGGSGVGIDVLPNHSLADTRGVGVYGQGAELRIVTVPPLNEAGEPIPGADVASGPRAAGAGIMGRGGESGDPRVRSASGVIGLAGGVEIPSSNQTLAFGVVGFGPVGVHGRGLGGPGIEGASASDRGGTFTSDETAQIQLVPAYHGGTFPSPVNVTPTALPTGREAAVKLPRGGRGGDLLALGDDQYVCSLWFCVQGVNSGPAKWAQVLTGPVFEGVA